MEIDWQDVTNPYSKNDEKKEPKIVELDVGNLMRIMVHRIAHYPGWYLTCFKLQIKNKELKANNLEDAKIEAVWIVLSEIEDL